MLIWPHFPVFRFPNPPFGRKPKGANNFMSPNGQQHIAHRDKNNARKNGFEHRSPEHGQASALPQRMPLHWQDDRLQDDQVAIHESQRPVNQSQSRVAEYERRLAGISGVVADKESDSLLRSAAQRLPAREVGLREGSLEVGEGNVGGDRRVLQDEMLFLKRLQPAAASEF